MRRYWWIPVLVLSHASMLWLARSASYVSPVGVGIASVQGQDPEAARWSPAELLLRHREREAAAAAAAEREIEWPDQVAAARAGIPVDADLPAMVAKGVEKEANAEDKFSAETVAAFGLWMDRDHGAALGWLGDFGRDYSLNYFEIEGLRWLGAGGHRQLNRLLATFPRIREYLLDIAGYLVAERGVDFALALGKTLDDPAERGGLLGYGSLEPEQMKGRLASFRELLDEEQAGDFLCNLASRDRAKMLLVDEVRAAGFPAAALAAYEEELADKAGAALEYEHFRAPEQKAEAEKPSATGIVSAIREFGDWCDDARDGRVTPEEVISRVREAKPEAAGVDRDLREYVFGELFQVDPQVTLQWYQGAVPDWERQFEMQLSNLKPEQIADLIEGYPGGIKLSDKAKIRIHERYQLWMWEDRKGCEEAIRNLPGGSLNAWLGGFSEGEGGR